MAAELSGVGPRAAPELGRLNLGGVEGALLPASCRSPGSGPHDKPIPGPSEALREEQAPAGKQLGPGPVTPEPVVCTPTTPVPWPRALGSRGRRISFSPRGDAKEGGSWALSISLPRSLSREERFVALSPGLATAPCWTRNNRTKPSGFCQQRTRTGLSFGARFR